MSAASQTAIVTKNRDRSREAKMLARIFCFALTVAVCLAGKCQKEYSKCHAKSSAQTDIGFLRDESMTDSDLTKFLKNYCGTLVPGFVRCAPCSSSIEQPSFLCSGDDLSEEITSVIHGGGEVNPGCVRTKMNFDELCLNSIYENPDGALKDAATCYVDKVNFDECGSLSVAVMLIRVADMAPVGNKLTAQDISELNISRKRYISKYGFLRRRHFPDAVFRK